MKLVAGQMALEGCEPLYKSAEYEGQWAQLESLVATRWPVLQAAKTDSPPQAEETDG